MTDPELAALEAIIAAPLAWSPIADLVAAGHALETLAGLQVLGLVEPWGASADCVWTLTPWGATVLEVVIIEHGPNEVPRWSQPWNAPRFVRVPRHRHEMRWPWMEELPSRDLGPLDVLILGEDAKPLLLFGRTVVKDKRIKPPPKAKKKKLLTPAQRSEAAVRGNATRRQRRAEARRQAGEAAFSSSDVL